MKKMCQNRFFFLKLFVWKIKFTTRGSEAIHVTYGTEFNFLCVPNQSNAKLFHEYRNKLASHRGQNDLICMKASFELDYKRKVIKYDEWAFVFCE